MNSLIMMGVGNWVVGTVLAGVLFLIAIAAIPVARFVPILMLIVGLVVFALTHQPAPTAPPPGAVRILRPSPTLVPAVEAQQRVR